MIYSKDSSIGSGSSDSDRNGEKQKGDAGEINVDNIVNSSNIELWNHSVNHVRNRFQPNHMYTSCHVFPYPEEGLSGKSTKKFTKSHRIKF